MPSSRPNTVPTVIHFLRQLRPRSILDVGIGFGKWGHLFREYTDIVAAEREPSRYQKTNWQIKIDGIEGHAAYLTEMHRYLYDEIYVGDACELIRQVPRYDLVFLGDIIEHLEKGKGSKFLEEAFAKCNQAVIATTPKYETGQTDLCANPLEQHRSLWTRKDFSKFAGAIVKIIDRDTLIAVLPKGNLPALVCGPPMRPKPADARSLRRTRAELEDLIPAAQPFILIDDEQIRTELPHTAAIPFLEKNGQYWGPPPDDQTAIRELERLRQGGAKFLAVAWASFWWLEHYAEFHRYLVEKFRCLRRTKDVVVFEL